MRFKNFVLFMFLFYCGLQQATARSRTYQDLDTASQELEDIQRVIEAALPDIESSLKAGNSFKPFAMTIIANDSIAEIEVRDSMGKGYTEEDLKEELSIGALKGDYKVVAIFYLSHATDPATGKTSKAVAIFAEHTNDDFAYLLYYPYTISPRKEVVFGNSFGDLVPQVMFKPD